MMTKQMTYNDLENIKNFNLPLYRIEGCLMISLVFLFSSLKSQEYSPLGTMPKTWLLKEFVQDYNDHERNNTVHGHILSCILLKCARFFID